MIINRNVLLILFYIVHIYTSGFHSTRTVLVMSFSITITIIVAVIVKKMKPSMFLQCRPWLCVFINFFQKAHKFTLVGCHCNCSTYRKTSENAYN